MIRARLSIWRVLPAMLVLLLLAGPAPLKAVAVAESVFTFSGLCTDCSGTATATLRLHADYVQGTDITNDDLISFVYDPTNLMPGGFTITAADDFSIGGAIPASLPAVASFNIAVRGFQFYTFDNGDWTAGGPSDYGTNGLWDGADADGAVPEPGAFLLVAGGMVLLGVRRWKVRN